MNRDSASGESSMKIWVKGNTVKVRPDDPVVPMPDEGVTIKACRNEYEPFQLIITAGNSELKNVYIEISDLEHESDGSTFSSGNIVLFRVVYITCIQPSKQLGESGEWPDALLPFNDPYEDGNPIGAPFNVTKAKNQPVWIRFFIPGNTSPGVYMGNITISAQNEEMIIVPITLEVWDFSLPEMGNLQAIYCVEKGSYLSEQFHVAFDSAEHDEIRMRYYDILADHGFAPGAVYYERPDYQEVEGKVQLDFNHSDILYSRYLNDRQVNAFAMPDPWDEENDRYIFEGNPTTTDFSDSEFRNKVKEYYSALYDHYREKDWIDRHYVYVLDETHWVSDEPYHHWENGYERVIQWSDLLHEANPDLKMVVMDFPLQTVPYWPDLREFADIWDPYMDDVDCYPRAIRDMQDAGKDIWITVNDYADFIDYSASYHRGIGWFAYKYDINGLDLWDTTFWWHEYKDMIVNPWKDDPYTYDGNGAGAILYPGYDVGIDGPVPSIRFELNREAVEDFEYLHLLETLGGRDLVDSIVTKILPYEFLSMDSQAESFHKVRETIAEAILDLSENSTATGKISGKVTDRSGSPVSGVFVSSSVSGAVSDENGYYVMAVPIGDHRIDVTSPAFRSCRYPLNHVNYEGASQQTSVGSRSTDVTLDFVLTEVEENVILISSFEGDINDWYRENVKSAEVTNEYITDGNSSYKVTFEDEKETELYYSINFRDSTGLVSFGFDVYNDQDEFSMLSITFGENWEFQKMVTLPPKTQSRIIIPVDEIREKIPLKGEITLGISVDNIDFHEDGSHTPLGRKTLFLDNVHFTGQGDIEKGESWGDDDDDAWGFLPGLPVWMTILCLIIAFGTYETGMRSRERLRLSTSKDSSIHNDNT